MIADLGAGPKAWCQQCRLGSVTQFVGGITRSDAKRLNALESKNARFQKLLAEQVLRSLALTPVQLGNTRMRPASCTFLVSQGCNRYQSSSDQDTDALAAWLIGLTQI